MHSTPPWFDRTKLMYVLVALVLALVGWRLAASSSDAPSSGAHTPAAPEEAVVRIVPAPAEPVTVHVAGAVRRPGVYELPDGARVIAAVRRAGGPARGAQLGALNLAAPVADGQQILVPRRGAAAAAGTSPSSPAAEAPVSLSVASAAELEALDGIGPTLAQRIVEWRERNGPFGAVDDLLEVPGIGEARLEALREEVVP